MVRMNTLAEVAVEEVGDALVSTINCTHRLAMENLPTNNFETAAAPRFLVQASKGVNRAVKGIEKATKLATRLACKGVDVSSGTWMVKKKRRDDQQPRRRVKDAVKEQTERVARSTQGAVTGVTTQLLGEEISEATRVSLSTVGHMVTLAIAVNELRAAFSPLNFVLVGPRFWWAVGAGVIG